MPKVSFPALLAAASLTLVVSACGGTSTQSQPSASAGGSSASSSSSPSSGERSSASASSSASSRDVVANPPKKSWQDAVDAAQKEFSDGKVNKVELESQEGGGYEYKVEQLSSDTKFAVQYDADTLRKLSQKRDGLGDDAKKKQKETFDPNSVISLGKAADTARQQQDGTITKWKIEGKDSGRVQYEFDITPPGASEDKEIQIDAKDGSVIKS